MRFTLLCSLVLCACTSSSEDAGPRSVVGRATGSEVFVAIVTDGAELFAYACDGTPMGTTETSWFVGQLDGDAFTASNPAGSQLDGAFGDDGAEGTLTDLAGTERAFTASVATDASGLYFGERGEDAEEIWGGWIVIGDEQRGAVVDRMTGDIVGSPSIDPASSSVDVDGAPLDYEQVDAPIGEALDDVPPG